MLATLTWPDTNPVGPASLIPLVTILLYVAVTWMLRSWPLLIAGLCIFSAATWFVFITAFAGRHFPNADDYVGLYLLDLTAICFAAEVARFGSRFWFWIGMFTLFILGRFLTYNVLERILQSTEWRQIMTDSQRSLLSLGGWFVVYLALVVRVRLQRRHRLPDNHPLQWTGPGVGAVQAS